MRHFLRDDDLSPTEQAEVLRRAAALKREPFADRCLEGPRTVSIIFDKPTLRTQVSFMNAVAGLGGHPMVVDGRLAGIGERESVPDVARILGPQSAAVVWRTFEQDRLAEMARYAGVPVVNALTDDFHPCQVLADLQTVREELGELPGRTLAYVGDGANNMAHSYLLGCATAGTHVRVGCPATHRPAAEVLARAEEVARGTGATVVVTDDPAAAVAGADVVATDTWVSMGMEAEADARHGADGPFAPFRVDAHLLDRAAPNALFLHCLPAYRGYEVTAEVIDGPRSRVWAEAENRMHAQKALLSWLVEQAEEDR
ncbi:ornithine carbamoyltransferase [Phycicoccus endophyticus]|uniref:Ornithine carbamoyltransferase n=1 Tax=Phycicoccus endophyticus TaxID=1690220 RepID=A0A7G9R5N9_9MICO|nr:ornithine carbamoyltransferase [Phycicoccus endophyticus]NHI18216.1 ornithine carbamoyltransferase [Phycicoccus endophyticus]QNN50914.1 ornithine carbamoyltransferase [Phycicoccus endophyticus]